MIFNGRRDGYIYDYFDPDNHDKFTFEGCYLGCYRCGNWDKLYSLLTKDGMIITEMENISRNFIKENIDKLFFLCGGCSEYYQIESLTRSNHFYKIIDNDIDIPKITNIGKQILYDVFEDPLALEKRQYYESSNNWQLDKFSIDVSYNLKTFFENWMLENQISYESYDNNENFRYIFHNI